jgi:hypothetical protein
VAGRSNCLLLSRAMGIDLVLSGGVDAIVAPSYSFASQPPAVAGYPNIAIPVGFTASGKPGGLWMYAGFLQEPKLLSFAYALEHLRIAAEDAARAHREECSADAHWHQPATA